MPVGSEVRWLDRAIASVGERELVVVLDGVGGRPSAVDLPPSAQAVTRNDRGGPAAARQTGLDALGEVECVALADADDEWEPGMLDVLLAALARHPEADVAFGRPLIVGPGGWPTGERWDEYPAGLLEPRRFGPLLFERDLIPMPGAVVRRSALEAAGGFTGGLDLPAATDWDLWLRLVRGGSAFVYEPSAVVRVRRHGRAVTGDVARLAEAGLAIHEHFAELAPPELRRRVRAADLTSLARGRVRERRYAEARSLLREAAALAPAGPRERLLRGLLAVPGAREVLGRRDPYRR